MAMRIATLCTLILCGTAAHGAPPTFTDTFPLKSCRFASVGGNDFFPLRPGRQLYLSNQNCVAAGDCDALTELWITTEFDTRTVTLGSGRNRMQVPTRVVEERETENGELAEISRNFFTSCNPMRDVYYFGEEVDIYEDGAIVSHEGAWLAGKNGALPGIVLPDSAFLVGSRYFQEVAPGVALDRGEHVATNLEVTVPAGTFKGCTKVLETTPLEPNSKSTKVYCPGVGLVRDDELELVAVFHVHDDEDDD